MAKGATLDIWALATDGAVVDAEGIIDTVVIVAESIDLEVEDAPEEIVIAIEEPEEFAITIEDGS